MSCFFALVGVGIMSVLLSIFISYILDTHNKWFFGKVRVYGAASFAFDAESGQIKIYAHDVCNIMKLIVIIVLLVIEIQIFENLNFVDSLYLEVMSVTTVGYGDIAFKTMGGGIFAILWLSLSTFIVELTFLSIIPTIIKRCKQKYTLLEDMTSGCVNPAGHRGAELVDASLDEKHDVDVNGAVAHIHGSLTVPLRNFKMVGSIRNDCFKVCDLPSGTRTTAGASVEELMLSAQRVFSVTYRRMLANSTASLPPGVSSTIRH
ncbi:Two-pore potassium channel 5 [Platanthera guangdongensis]|uniref:Two-pore potassium channel 5 n=1 Tax=Platanthera guangdongensis TaxID=2320717 RepID=A0ABR2MZD7_9ASPA